MKNITPIYAGVKQISKMFDVSTKAIESWIKEDKVRVVVLGKGISSKKRVVVADVVKIFEKGNRK